MGKSRPKNLSKNKFILVFSIVTFIVLLFSILFNKKSNIPKEVKININDYKYYLETASTKEARRIGLSKRQNLCINCGMLFIFEKEAIAPFWMKDTLVPLDIIWIDKNFKVVKIVTALETNSQKTYTAKAKYAIELNANEVFKRNLKVGDTIQLPDFNE